MFERRKVLPPASSPTAIYIVLGAIMVVGTLVSASNGPIVFGEGPHSVLVEELAGGRLRVSQCCACCNIVGRERR